MDKQANDLKLLRAQVNPHFLFNALNSILAVCDEPQKVTAITQALADYLRFSLRGGDARQPLGEELDALESYLKVEKIRFTDRLEYTIQADAAARSKLVPGALVQPLVENAIKFGQRTSPCPLRIVVQARLLKGNLEVLVENSGHWVSKKDPSSTGIGLSSLRQRLELLCGPLATVTVKTPSDRVILQVILPEAYLLSSKR
jgi:LytS/YehU family sensor histidine kinase